MVLLLLLEALVGTQFSEVGNKQAAAIRRALASSKDIIAVDMNGSHLIFMALQRSSGLKRHKVPHRHCLLAGSEEQASDGVDEYILHASVELRPCQIRYQFFVLKVPQPDVLGG